MIQRTLTASNGIIFTATPLLLLLLEFVTCHHANAILTSINTTANDSISSVQQAEQKQDNA